MADWKGRSVTFKVPHAMKLRELKTGWESGIASKIVVFQSLGGGEYLLEFSSVNDAEMLSKKALMSVKFLFLVIHLILNRLLLA